MIDVYRSDAGRAAVARWCDERLAAWGTPHQRRYLDVVPARETLRDRGATTGLPADAAGAVRTHVVVAGDPAGSSAPARTEEATDETDETEAVDAAGGSAGLVRPQVVVLPDVLSCAAALTDAVDALLAVGLGPVWVVDVPGQPGASDGRRPRRRCAAWSAAWLDGLLGHAAQLVPAGPGALPGEPGDADHAGGPHAGLLVVAHGSGAVPVLGSATSGLRRLLVSPAGIVSTRPGPLVARDLERWATRATPATADAVARRLLGGTPLAPRTGRAAGGRAVPGADEDVPAALVGWLELVGRSCQAPLPVRPLAKPDLDRSFAGPTVVLVGEADALLDPGALVAALARREPDTLGAGDDVAEGIADGTVDAVVEVVPGMGRVPGSRHWQRVAAAALVLEGAPS